MRIAVTGTHRVGKSTLIEALEERLAEYRVVDETISSNNSVARWSCSKTRVTLVLERLGRG